MVQTCAGIVCGSVPWYGPTMRRSFHDHFSSVSGSYAQYRPRYPEALFTYLASLTTRRESAWDCATGSGQAALPLAAHFSRVIATDASVPQISKAARHARLHFFVAAAEAGALRPASVDLVTVAQALHWFDLPRFYAEVDRVLRSGGVLAVWSYGRLQADRAPMQNLLDRFYNDTVGPYWPPERRWVEEGYASLAFPYEEIRPPAFSLTAAWTLPHLAGYLRTWSATQRYTKTQGIDPVSDLVPQLAPHWGEPQTVHTLRWPLTLRLGVKPF